MKKYVLMTAFIFIVMLFGCSHDKYVPLPYSIENAYKNNDVIDIICGNKHYNLDKLDEFVNSVKNGESGKIRIVSYNYDQQGRLTLEYPEHIYDLYFDGNKINIIVYSTASSSENILMETASKSFESINIVESEHDTQYVIKNSSNKIIIFSAVKNGWISEDTQKCIEEKLK